MIIQQQIDTLNLASVTPLQAGLPLPLPQPILLKGAIREEALMAQIVGWIDADSATASAGRHWLTIGVDEVGRGTLYGSLVVAAAILPEALSAETDKLCLQQTVLADVADSKKLTERKREQLFEPIKQQALAYLIVDVPAAVIDDINILQATMQAMRLASEQLMLTVTAFVNEQLSKQQTTTQKSVRRSMNMGFKLLIDGNKLPDFDNHSLSNSGIKVENSSSISNDEPCEWAYAAEAWVKGDARHTAIAAASILAKVTRDRQLIADGQRYPGYGLKKHKGYPTKAHIQAISELGVLPEHRRSYKPIQEALNRP